jgi:hypothetical protein
MCEFNPFKVSELIWDIIQVYLNHGFENVQLYDLIILAPHYTDETVCMTLGEFAEKAIDYDDMLWCGKELRHD